MSRPPHPIVRLPAVERVKVNEIFYSLQGESTFAGRPCVMVRLTGCQMRCRWCDTEYSFYRGEWMTISAVIERVAGHGCDLVEVTGGEPLLQPGAFTLMRRLCDAGYEVLVETGGGIDVAQVDPRVRRIVDVKCPGSGESAGNRLENLEHLNERDELKLVLADRRDYLWARDLLARQQLWQRCAVSLSPVHGELDPCELAEWILADRLPVRLQTQLHKQLWGERPGV